MSISVLRRVSVALFFPAPHLLLPLLQVAVFFVAPPSILRRPSRLSTLSMACSYSPRRVPSLPGPRHDAAGVFGSNRRIQHGWTQAPDRSAGMALGVQQSDSQQSKRSKLRPARIVASRFWGPGIRAPYKVTSHPSHPFPCSQITPRGLSSPGHLFLQPCLSHPLRGRVRDKERLPVRQRHPLPQAVNETAFVHVQSQFDADPHRTGNAPRFGCQRAFPPSSGWRLRHVPGCWCCPEYYPTCNVPTE